MFNRYPDMIQPCSFYGSSQVTSLYQNISLFGLSLPAGISAIFSLTFILIRQIKAGGGSDWKIGQLCVSCGAT